MSKYYYNGVLLPEIPRDILAEYPNVFIYKWADSGIINFMAAPINNKWYYYYDSTYHQIRISECSYKRYTYNTDTDAWKFIADHTDNGRWGVDVGSVIWSNNTIPSGNVDSTTAYFPKCGVCQYTTKKLDYNGVTLPSIPTEHFATHPFVWIRKNLSSGYYDLCMDTAQWYYNNNNGIYPTASTTQYWYRIPIATAGACTEWEFYKETTGGYTIDESRVVLWSLQDISNGKKSTTVYFNETSPVVDLSITKYLVRNNDTIYTVTDGSLVEVSGELNSNLFLDNGVDTIPDGALLMTLSNPEVLCWTDSDKVPTLTATVKGIPQPQVIVSEEINLMDGSIKGIESVTIDCKGEPIFAVSFDKKASWIMHNGTDWVNVADELTGMTKTVFEAVTTEQWQTQYETASDMYIRCTLLDETQSLTSITLNFIN